MNVVCDERDLLRTWFVMIAICNEGIGNEWGLQ